MYMQCNLTTYFPRMRMFHCMCVFTSVCKQYAGNEASCPRDETHSSFFSRPLSALRAWLLAEM